MTMALNINKNNNINNNNNQCNESEMYLKWLTGSVCAFCLACGSVMNFNRDDKISVSRGIFITTMGVIFFASLAEFLNKYFLCTKQGKNIQMKYHLLLSDVMEINNKTVSAVQAILSSTAGYLVCRSSCRISFLHASHFMSDGYAWFGAAYFIYDMWYMYKVYLQKLIDKTTAAAALVNNLKEENGQMDNHAESQNGNCGANEIKQITFIEFCIKNPVMIIHHTFLGSFGLLVIVYLRGNFGDCVYSFIYLMELSTPFVSIRSVLSLLGMKNSTAYVLNGIAMLISFFICRIVMWPYLFWWYSTIVQKTMFDAITSLPMSCKIGTLILFLPQVYWFSLMLKGAAKIIFGSSQKSIKKTN